MNTEEDILNIQVNGEGTTHLLRLLETAKRYFFASIVVSVIFSFDLLIRVIIFRKSGIPEGSLQAFSMTIYFYYAIFYEIIFLLQIVYFVKFSRRSSYAIKMGDTVSFNQSFYWLNKNAVLGVVLNVLNFLMFLIFLYEDLTILKSM
jgi:hypothetical protein